MASKHSTSAHLARAPVCPVLRPVPDGWPLSLEQLTALNAALEAIRAEVFRAARKHGGRPFASPHEGYGVILEEVDEFWDEVKANNASAALDEVTQVGAMAAFYITTFGAKEKAHA